MDQVFILLINTNSKFEKYNKKYGRFQGVLVIEDLYIEIATSKALSDTLIVLGMAKYSGLKSVSSLTSTKSERVNIKTFLN